MKKVVLKVEVHDDKIKKKAMKAVSGLSGVESVSMDMKDKKLTLTGDIDAVYVVAKLRKFCSTEIVSVGPAKEEKKEEPKKEDKKKPDDKKDSAKEKKIVLKVEALHDNKCKKKTMKVVSRIPGIDSVSVDMKDYKLTLIGDIDPVTVVGKLRKLCHTEILSLGPAKEEKKKEQEKKKNEDLVGIVKTCCEAFEACQCHTMRQQHYCHISIEENPSACVIF